MLGRYLPVLLVNCHGGSARIVLKRRPPTKLSKSVAASREGFIGACPLVFDISGSANTEDDDRASSSAAAFKPREKLRHVGCRVTKARAPAELVEDLLQFGTPRNDNACVDRAKIEQQTKIVQVAIEERILVVPLHFERDPVLVAVDFVGGSNVFGGVHHNFRVELFLRPAKACEVQIQLA